MARCLAVGLAVALAVVTPAPTSAQHTLHDVAVLTGCWADLDGPIELQEQWSPANGGIMLSTTRFLRDGVVVDWEFGRIVEDGSGVTLWPYPKGVVSEHGFPLVRTGEEIVFENPEHDFPVRIIYAPVGAHAMEVRIEGDAGQVIGWSVQRVSCPGGR